jgi:hypothetical protein
VRSPLPTLATPRRPDLATHSGRVAVVAKTFLGLDLWPWQRQVLDVALERNPDGRPRYKRIVVSVPRQSGKTELLGALLFTRMLEGRWSWYTAQNRTEAFDTFVMRWAQQWEAAPFGIKPRRSAEMPGAYAPNGGAVRIFRPDGYGLHGKQADLIVIDEAWGLDYATGLELDQAAGPTGQTRPEYQEWIISTAGNADSVYLAEKIASARDLVDGDDRSAVFIWDAAGCDPDNIDTILERHPARGTPVESQAFDHIRSEYAIRDRAEFMRAYGNIWPNTAAEAFGPRFDLTADPQLRLPTAGHRGLVFAADASPNAGHATITASWQTPNGPAVAIVNARAGTSWLTNELRDLNQKWRPREIVVDAMSMAAGPARAANLPNLRYTDTKELVAAAAWMADPANTYWHIPDPTLTDAAHSMRRRKIGERFAFGRASDGAPIDPLVAASLSLYAIAVSRHALVMV